MIDETLTSGEAQREFWRRLRDSMTVMLGINDPDQHAQPMTAFPEPENNTIWFFTRDDIAPARANLTHSLPKAGGVTDVSFRH